MARQLTAKQILRLARSNRPFYAERGQDGVFAAHAWDWDRDARLEAAAAGKMNAFDREFRKVMGREFRSTDARYLTGDREYDNLFVRQQRDLGNLYKQALDAGNQWGARRRDYERSIGLTKRKGRRGGAMALGTITGMRELLQHMKETEPALLKEWKTETKGILERKVIPPVKRKAPVRRGDGPVRVRGPRLQATSAQRQAQLAYAYPANRAKVGSGKPKQPPGSLRKSVRTKVTTKTVGVTVGGTVKVPYAPPIIWGWELRNIPANDFLWDAIEDTVKDVTDSLLAYTAKHAERHNRKLNYQQKVSPSAWKAAMDG